MKDWKQQKVHGLVTIYYTNLFFFSDLFSACFLVKWYCKGHFLVLFFNLMMMFFIIWQFDWGSGGMCPRFELGRDFAREGVSVFHFPFPTTYPFVHFLFATWSPCHSWFELEIHISWKTNIYELHSLKAFFPPQKYEAEDLGDKKMMKKNSQAPSERPSPTKKKKNDKMFYWSSLMNF